MGSQDGEERQDSSSSLDRRAFLKTASMAAGATAGLMASGNFAYARGSDELHVGLVGCGGRGTGAARDCINAAEGVYLTAMGDLFPDHLAQSRARLEEALGDRYQVTDARSFTGFDNYRHVIQSEVDLVLLATPPAYRPIHFREAVEAGKHVFIEKPVSVDVAGARSIIDTGELADEKGLSVAAGTQYRRQPSFVETIDRLHDGIIGDLVAAQAHYLTGPIWHVEREPGMSDMEWQCRNWYYFTWLSGDHIVEQFIHNIDTLNWVFDDHPTSCIASGGRLQRVDPKFGHIYDHFSVDYVYPNGARVTAHCRQMQGAHSRISNHIRGTRGSAILAPNHSSIIDPSQEFIFDHPEAGNNPYEQTHVDLVGSIRSGVLLNEARSVAESTLTAVMGREAAYTGQEITWEDLLSAEMDLVPDSFAFGSAPNPKVAVPGRTALDRSWASVAV